MVSIIDRCSVTGVPLREPVTLQTISWPDTGQEPIANPSFSTEREREREAIAITSEHTGGSTLRVPVYQRPLFPLLIERYRGRATYTAYRSSPGLFEVVIERRARTVVPANCK